MSKDLSRRTFLKIIAVTGAAASGCTQPPTRELIPYVVPDENIIPGVPSFFATVCRECPATCGVVARVREGRVITLEGNPNDPVNGGALCARGQAALQGLYHPDRLATPQLRGTDGALAPVSWEVAAQSLASRLSTASAAGQDRVAFLGPPMGPTLDRIIERWLRVWRSNRLLRYEALDEAAARSAGELCFGRTDLPVYQLDAADVLVSFGADFLETWRSPVELTRQYAAFRAPRVGREGITMGRAVYVGPRFGVTAAKSDEQLRVRPGDEVLIALSILQHLAARRLLQPGVDLEAVGAFTAGYAPAVVSQRTGVPAATIQRVAEWFGNSGTAVALAGTADTATHVTASVLNAVTGNIGKTVRYREGPRSTACSPPSDIAALLDALRVGAVDVLVVADANPVFTLPGFTDALSRVPFVVWCGGVPDETAVRAHLTLPRHHVLETWSDAAPRPGVALLGQPVMQPVFSSLPLGDILLASVHAAGASANTLPWENTQAAVEATWRELHAQRNDGTSFDSFWQQARESGGSFSDAPVANVALRPEVLRTPLSVVPSATALTLVAVPHIFLYDGRGADKPWLQEIPEPVAQIVWDSWADVHPDTAHRLAVAEGDVLEMRSTQGTIEVPVRLSDRVPREVVIVFFGQGHTAYGRYAAGRGANPWQLLPLGARHVAVEARATGARRALVSPMALPDMLGRPIVEAASLQQLGHPQPSRELAPAPYQIRPPHHYAHHQWGMTIDLNACTGCSACVAACYAENNLAVVGKTEVQRGHIKSWIRIERYVPTTAAAPPLYIMPMLCQQCDNAPCESVCPVYASSHTEDGLNAQVYNRCIGTRYCENNCPYKVRRFNWCKAEWPPPLQLQLNPDVTVRGAGVMEKCTFCVQRIRAAEMDARADHRAVRDGEIIPACAQACPARAITFGDMKDAHSAMMQRRAAHAERAYRALDMLNTQPAIVYLRDVYREPGEM